MTSQDAYAALLDHARQIEALGQVAGLLSWDQEAMMPPNGAEARAEQAGAMSSVLHAKRTDLRIPEWIAAIDANSLDTAGRANLRLMQRNYDRSTRTPADLATEIARKTARGHGVWADARARGDVSAFLPTLSEIVELVREQAGCLATGEQSAYDALVDIYEPGATADSIAAIFARLRTGLVDLRGRIAERAHLAPVLTGTYPAEAQRALANKLAKVFEYDLKAGRIDLVVHPFCSGTRGDVRITTRVDEGDPFNCLYSTVHETGHAIYEQGLDPALAWQPAGGHASMGVHESQSRLCENQIGRSQAFCTYLFPQMQAHFSDFALGSADDLYRAINRVHEGYIRTEADEIHYNLHIMLRFELERALIGGELQVADLEGEWNARFEADFGRAVDRPENGVLQDVHWSAGLFGYFPTYALGNIYAGELFAAMQDALPDLQDDVRKGELSKPVDWLRANIHRPGSLDSPSDTIARACGHMPTEAPLLDYLNLKFGALYDL